MNRDYFTQPHQSDRLAQGHGNTRLEQEARSPAFMIIGGIVFMLAGLAVMW
jgi:hypothetical protein